MRAPFAATLLLICLAPAARAQQTVAAFEVTPFGGWRIGGSFELENSPESWDLDDSASFGLILNFPHRANTRWEVFYSRQATKAEFSDRTGAIAPIDIASHVLQLGGTYQFEGDKVVPYLAATLGGTWVRASANGSESDAFWSGSLGLGLLISPNSRVGLRLEARGHATLTSSSTDLLCVSGPDLNACAIEVTGDVVTQVETFAGVVIRF